jgi:hypothetical protein
MLPIIWLGLALWLCGCTRPIGEKSVWSVQKLAGAQGDFAVRILPKLPWMTLSPPPQQWAEFQLRDELQLVLFSSNLAFLRLSDPGGLEELQVRIGAGKESFSMQTTRLAGGQQWLCPSACTRRIAEALAKGQQVSISHGCITPEWIMDPAGFQSCLMDLEIPLDPDKVPG